MNFDDALKLLRAGHMVRLKTWDKETYLKMDDKGVMKFFLNAKDRGANTSLGGVEISSMDWVCSDWGTFYDKGYDEGYKVGYDEAIEKYLDALDKLAASGGHDLRNILLALKRQSNEIHKSE